MSWITPENPSVSSANTRWAPSVSVAYIEKALLAHAFREVAFVAVGAIPAIGTGEHLADALVLIAVVGGRAGV